MWLAYSEVGIKEDKAHLTGIMVMPGVPFRMKKRYYHGKAKKESPYNPWAPVLQGCKAYEERLLLNAKTHHLSERAAVKAHYRKNVLNSETPVAVGMVLGLGNVLMMHGAEFQRYFEVSTESQIVAKQLLNPVAFCHSVSILS